MSEGFAG